MAASSTCTSVGCARRSRPTRRTPATSSPCAGWGIASKRDVAVAGGWASVIDSAVDAGTTTATAVDTAVPTRKRWLWLFPRRPGPLGLRRRILLIFTLGALGLATFLSFTTYGLVRSN